MLQVTRIQKSFGPIAILNDASFSLGKGQKAALVGHNGTGKTTLLRIIAGLENADAGNVTTVQNACIGYLPQDTSLADPRTIAEYLKDITGIGALEQEMEKLLPVLEDKANQDRYSEVYELYEHLGGYGFEAKMEAVLAGLGLKDVSTDREIPELSSGQKSKVVLAGILLKGVDLLLLDEPTNNLDLPALMWLEYFLKGSDASCIIVSHDKYFLDRTVRKIFYLDWHTRMITATNGSYSEYLAATARKIERDKEKYNEQQDEIERLAKTAEAKKSAAMKGSNWSGTDNDKFARGFKRDQSAKSSKTARNIEKRIEQMEKIKKPTERSKLILNIVAQPEPSNSEIEISHLLAGYSGGFLLGPFSCHVKYGERVAFMGLNGSGKSTLLKTITGQLKPISGQVIIGSGLRIGNMTQEHELLDREQSLVDFLKERVSASKDEIHSRLVQFGFRYEQIYDPISTLSPGGRARLIFAYFEMSCINALVLDEPTNHLDIEALEALEEVLESFSGTVLLVTHDRSLLERARLDSVYMIEERSLHKIPNYEKYIQFAEQEAKKLFKMLS